ncbi:MAG: phosphatidylserine decarboxylase [Bacteroidetes bacterium 4572_77]|nr:MAG: phosphatidylserine decarboxylase [Bacteroidetes bacterium 4572_77]
MKTKRIVWILLAFIIVVSIYPFGNQDPIRYVERKSDSLKTEQIAGEMWLRWLYNNPIGELSTVALVKRKFLSDWYGEQMDKPSSRDKVAPFVANYNIDISIAQKQEFESFNDFFCRKLKPEARPINSDSLVVVSPADGKVLAYQNIENQDFIVKGYRFNVEEFLQNDSLSEIYKDGSMMIIRLCPTDYHRYHFPVAGDIVKEHQVSGDYYSVSPIALKKKVELLSLNKRAYALIDTPQFGKVIMAEVAATMVGSMVNTYEGPSIEKGQERGYFKFGGSTVILFFEPDSIFIDQDLIDNTLLGLETEVQMGEQIAVSTSK